MQQLQTSLLSTYRHDFGKYATKTQHQHLQKLFIKIPQLIAQDFKFTLVDAEVRSRELKIALEKLHDAGLILPSYAVSASGLPLASQLNEKKMKLFFLDIGLIMRALQIESQLYYEENLLLINQGALAEQFVGQELLAYHDPFDESQLFFWSREKSSSQASVDFVIAISGHIIPIEVKSGKTGRLKSLHLFMEEKKSTCGIRISQSELSLENKIMSIPLYLISEIPRLIKGCY
jgi:predicted AAA+ superfamily ATPase